MGVVPEYVVTFSDFSFLSRGWFAVYGVPVSAFVECFSVWRAAWNSLPETTRASYKRFISFIVE